MGLFGKKRQNKIKIKNRTNQQSESPQRSSTPSIKIAIPQMHYSYTEACKWPDVLTCADGTKMRISSRNLLITGISRHKNEILSRYIASSIRDGATPIVLSSSSTDSEIYSVLRQFYYAEDIKYIANNDMSDYYKPFMNKSIDIIRDFFYELLSDIKGNTFTNSILCKKYINVCVQLFNINSNLEKQLMRGQIDHNVLLSSLYELRECGRITDLQADAFRNDLNASVSVSIDVISVMYDFFYNVQQAFCSKPGKFPFNITCLMDQKPLYFKLQNDIVISNRDSFKLCYSWYISKLIRMEFQNNRIFQSKRFLLIIDNVKGIPLAWFSWLFEQPNLLLLLNNDDYYANLLEHTELRENLCGKMEMIFMFSHLNSASSDWCSDLFGVRKVERKTTTRNPARTWGEIILGAPVSTSVTEMDEAWYPKEEIQTLGDTGVVYCRSDNIFKSGKNFCRFLFE